MKDDQVNAAIYMGMIMGAYHAMPEKEKEALHEWERTHLGHGFGTSDWPGWEKYIGKPPKRMPRPKPTPKQVIPPKLRWQVLQRDNFACCNCGSLTDLTIDHIVSEKVGGKLELSNLQTLCRRCNSRKGTKLNQPRNAALN